MPAKPKDPAYETESKVDMAKLREAVQKVFAYDTTEKDSAESSPAKHRRRVPKKVGRSTG